MENSVNSQSLSRLLVFFGIITVLLVVTSVSTTTAIMPMPKIGIDYQSMKVEDPTILENEGMKDVKRGDSVDVRMSSDSTVTVDNKRTRKSVTIDLSQGHYY